MLRDYQSQIIQKTYASWDSGKRNALMVLPTGAGKTYTFSSIIKERNVPSIVMAHRQELVGQMSLSLAQMGIYHRIIAADKTITEICKAHREVLGRSYYDPTSLTLCASVDTLIRRRNPALFNSIRLWVIDEAHHVLTKNKWGEAASMFPNAMGLGVTATPLRADGKGLGRHSDGVFDELILGPTGDDLIDMGYLSPYSIICPKIEDLDFSDVETGATGDLKQNQLRMATHRSKKIVGGTVESYLKYTPNWLGITFCVDIQASEETAAKYNEAGVPAAIVSSRTPFLERVRTLQKFKRRELLQLVNVDLFGEGFDVPGVEVVIKCRRTESFALDSQQSGRAFRPVYAEGFDLSTAEGRKAAIAFGPKPEAAIIDTVGNFHTHLLPTGARYFTLDARERKAKGKSDDNSAKLKSCENELCLKAYHAYLDSCPHCGHTPVRSPRPASRPEEVDGELARVDLDVVRRMQAEAARVVGDAVLPKNLTFAASKAAFRRHDERRQAQTTFRENVALWAGYRRNEGLSVAESQKLFYLKFGVDVLTAQTLSKKETEHLNERVINDF